MAKVTVSLPDELLIRVDAEAERSGRTRSAVLREFADLALGGKQARLTNHMRQLNREAQGRGGHVVAELKAGRPT